MCWIRFRYLYTFPVSGTRYHVPGTRYLVPGGTWYLGRGTRSFPGSYPTIWSILCGK